MTSVSKRCCACWSPTTKRRRAAACATCWTTARAELPLEIVGEARNGRAGAGGAAPHATADVVLLDIRMPEMDGIEAAQHIQKLAEPPAVIFTTAYDAYALKAFEVHALDYLLKPIRLSRLFDALARVRSITPLSSTFCARSPGGAPATLSVKERGRVIWCRSTRSYFCGRAEIRDDPHCGARIPAGGIAGAAGAGISRPFVRIHRSCLVAKDAIRGFERALDADGEGHWVVVLNNVAEKIDVSRRQQHIVRELGRIL